MLCQCTFKPVFTTYLSFAVYFVCICTHVYVHIPFLYPSCSQVRLKLEQGKGSQEHSSPGTGSGTEAAQHTQANQTAKVMCAEYCVGASNATWHKSRSDCITGW
jgi:hypothetical protein